MKKALVALLTVTALFAFASCSKEPTKINVNDYFKYELSGITGNGVVTYSIDAEGILDDNEEVLDGCTEKKITNALQGAWDKEAEIANGDEIKFKWDLDTDVIEKKYNVIFEAEDVKVTVKDLEELPTMDAFDYLKITFSGTSPNGAMSVDNTLSSAPVSGLRFSFDKERDFKNGDVVTVTLTAGSNDVTEYCKEKGYTLVSDKKEFKVEGLDEYVTSKDEITDDIITELSKQAEDKFYSSIEDWEAKLDSVEYFGYYFATLKDGVESGYGRNHNYLYIVLQPKSTNENETLTYFYYVRFEDIIKKPDGSNEIYDIYSTDVPEGSYFFGLSGEAFLSEGEEHNFCYEGYRNTADLYNAVLRPMSEYYIVDKSFDKDVEGTSTAPESAPADTEATEETEAEETEATEETEAEETEAEETEAEETEETEATEEAA